MDDSRDAVDVARAFSSHRFEEVADRLAPDVRWIAVGQTVIEGRDGVLEACAQTARHLAETRTEFTRFVVASGGDVVAVDVIARYIERSGEVSVVSSCDVYEFDAGALQVITSYAVELAST